MAYYERNLPHWQPEGKTLFLTWRLYGSLPARFLLELQKFTKEPGRQFLEADRKLDAAATGPRWLASPRVAECVQDAIRRGESLAYFTLHAYVIMPNHVHVLLDPRVALRRITKGMKGASARAANRNLHRQGRAFWQDESFDHWVRSGAQLEKFRAYIEWNPVIAGLAKRPEEWPWSSACR